MEDYSIVISRNLIQLRKSRGLTQQDFAGIVKYSDKTVSKWELGYAIPSIETLKDIADYYGVTVDYFLHSHDDVPEHTTKIMSLKTRRILLLVLFDLFFLLIAATVYAAIVASVNDMHYWSVFLWALSVIFLFNALFANNWWKNTILPYLFSSATIWTVLISIYVTLISFSIEYNFWYLFFVGLPIQAADIIILTLTHSSIRK